LRSKLGLAMGAMTAFGMILAGTPVGVAPELTERSIDLWWVIHTDPNSPGCERGQHLYARWTIRGGGLGWYQVDITGSNLYGVNDFDPIGYHTGPFQVSGDYDSDAVEVYESPCFGLADHGMALSDGTLSYCGVTSLTCPGSPVATDDADCHWGHDAYCDGFSGD